jgi:superfamily II DNA or RNA helicase
MSTHPELLAEIKAAVQKQADLKPEVNLQPHQERIQDLVDETSPRVLVYHGLGSGKSLSAIAAAEAAKKKYNEEYGIVAPASLRKNFHKEIEKFTENSEPEVLSYTGLGLGKKFQGQPDTLIFDEAHRIRNPGGAAAQAARDAAARAKRVMLLTGTPITNSPGDLAHLISILAHKNLSPQEFENKFVGYKKVYPGLVNYFSGIKPGVQAVIRNEKELRSLLENRVDYQPSKTPEGVNVNEERIAVPLTDAQKKIQKALRTKIPPSFLWKLDKEFPLSKDELAKLNSFLTGLRQNSVSTRTFRSDNDALRSFYQSGKLQEAYNRLKTMLADDPRKKAIIYSNHIGAGIEPYAAALERHGVPYGIFHGGVSMKQRQKALADYNAGRLRALLIGPAGAEGLSTKGTNLIQLLDPHWNEARTQQAQGRGLRFDSHDDLPDELKNVHVQRFISESEEPSWLGKMLGYRRERTGDEILERLSKEKERLNERFRELLREVGTRPPKEEISKNAAYGRNDALADTMSIDGELIPDPETLDDDLEYFHSPTKAAALAALIKTAAEKSAGIRFYKRFPVNKNVALNLSLGGPSLTFRQILPKTSLTLGNRAPRIYVGTPIPGLAYQQYISKKKHKIRAEKDFADEKEDIDRRTSYEKIRDFLFGTPLTDDDDEG